MFCMAYMPACGRSASVCQRQVRENPGPDRAAQLNSCCAIGDSDHDQSPIACSAKHCRPRAQPGLRVRVRAAAELFGATRLGNTGGGPKRDRGLRVGRGKYIWNLAKLRYRSHWFAAYDDRSCDMSCYCLSKYHERASRDALRTRSGWISTVIHGPSYEPDYGPRHASGRRTAICGPCCTPDQLQRHRAAGPSDQRTDDADTYQ